MVAGDVLWTPPADIVRPRRVGDFLRFLARHRAA